MYLVITALQSNARFHPGKKSLLDYAVSLLAVWFLKGLYARIAILIRRLTPFVITGHCQLLVAY